MLYFKLYYFTLLKHLVVSHSYLCISVKCCSIISQVIIYLKLIKRWISILNLALFCSTLPVALPVVDLPPSHSLFLWLLRTSSRSARCRLVSVSIFVALVQFAWDLESLYSLQTCFRHTLCCFCLFRTTSRSARCRLVCVSIFDDLFLFAQDLESLCSLQSCLRLNLSCFVLLNTSSYSAHS